MKIEDIKAIRDTIAAAGVIFCYSGPVSQGLVEEVGQAVRLNVSSHAENRTIIERIFGIFIEQVQNIMNYSAEQCDSVRSGIVLVGKDANDFFVVCGNVVDDANKRKIECTIDEIEGKDKPALKALYKQKLKQTDIQIGKGAGLGLIDIARKASKPVEYCFQDMEIGHSFFSSKVTISEEL